MPEPVFLYTAGKRLMDGYQIMELIQRTGRTAIVRDLSQQGDNGVYGDYYDAYVDGRLICPFDTPEEAYEAIRKEKQRLGFQGQLKIVPESL